MREKIIAGNIYHVLNRGVDKRKIFLNEEDYFRFVHDLFEFNDTKPVNNVFYSFRHKNNDVGHHYIETAQKNKKPRKLLVKILAFSLMPNHYHLLLQPKFDDGVFRFMKKLNGGYAKYFNEKYERTGTLFEGRYKSITIDTDSHFIHIPYYIHFNPLDLVMPEWRRGKVRGYKKAMKFLENYRWSSFPDYIGKKNFPSVTQRDFLLQFFGGEANYENKTINWLKDSDNASCIKDVKDLILE